MTILANRPQSVDEPKRANTVTMPVRTLVALVLIAVLVVLLAWWTGLKTNIDASHATKVYSGRAYVGTEGAELMVKVGQPEWIPDDTLWLDRQGNESEGSTAPCLRFRSLPPSHYVQVRIGVTHVSTPSESHDETAWVQCLGR